MKESQPRQVDIIAWYPVKKEIGRTLNTMEITDHDSWCVYLGRTLDGVVERLGEERTWGIIEAEQDQIISKQSVVNFFSEILGL